MRIIRRRCWELVKDSRAKQRQSRLKKERKVKERHLSLGPGKRRKLSCIRLACTWLAPLFGCL
jgi:hypothetical protein